MEKVKTLEALSDKVQVQIGPIGTEPQGSLSSLLSKPTVLSDSVKSLRGQTKVPSCHPVVLIRPGAIPDSLASSLAAFVSDTQPYLHGAEYQLRLSACSQQLGILSADLRWQSGQKWGLTLLNSLPSFQKGGLGEQPCPRPGGWWCSWGGWGEQSILGVQW